MIPLDNAVVARLERHGLRFEVLVDPDKAALIRHGEEITIEDAVAALHVFESASHASRSSDEDLLKVFKTTNFDEIAKVIIKDGEIHLTSEQRRQIVEEKRRKVISYIARNAVNPQTGLPHPPQRIEMAMEEARVNIDPFKNVDVLVKETMKALRPLIPIRFQEVRLAVKIPPLLAAKAFSDISGAATMERDEWQNDGSWICVVRIPAGAQSEFYELLNRITKGEADVKILDQIY